MESLFIGKNSVFLLEVESTNTYAMEMLRNVNPSEGTVIFTNNQTKGKGQRGATWHSTVAENIILSIILKPSFLSLKQSFYLSKITALALYDVLAETLVDSQCDIKIKWPNDILVQNKKIAGVLIENNINGNSYQHAVIGIGLNVNQVDFSDLETVATSLKKLTSQHLETRLIQEKLYSFFEKWYLKLKERRLELIDEVYLNRLFGINTVSKFKDTNNIFFSGKIIRVDVDGKLVVEMPDGSFKYFELKEIKFDF